MRKTTFLAMAGGYFLVAAAANAEMDVQLNVGQPAYPAPAYVAPASSAVYVEPYPRYHDPWHRREGHEYWERHKREHFDHDHR